MRLLKAVAIAAAVLVGIVVLAGAVSLSAYRIPSSSMEPTLKIGSRILVLRLG